jgi:hypothetical protein
MKTFAQRQTRSQQESSTNLTSWNASVASASHAQNSILHPRPTNGNQAALRTPEAETQNLVTHSDAATHFAHDFSRIPLHAPAPVTIQPKLTVNTPGDAYEQEADHVAEQVMRMSEPNQSTCACGGGCSTCQSGSGGNEPLSLQTKHVGSSDAGQIAAPPIVHEVLASPGQRLDASTRAFFEPRFGQDFSNVRVHTDSQAAKSADAVDANAYTVGRDIVFGGRHTPPESTEGRPLLAHELAHVVQQADTSVVRRDIVRDRAGNITAFEFRVSHELTQTFVKEAKKLTSQGTLQPTDILKLTANSIKERDTVSDHERMFMAGLLDTGNVRMLQGLRVNATAAITFQLATITDARVTQVIQTGQPAMPISVSDPFNKAAAAANAFDLPEAWSQVQQADAAAETEIRTLVAPLNAKVGSVLAFAKSHGLLSFNLLVAVQKAASDNAPNDRLLAAAVYSTAAAAGHPLAEDLLKGNVHVDALAPTRFLALPGATPALRALYIPAASINPKFAGLKGDTVYMPDDFDIDKVYDRSNVIHELRHAQDDKAGPATGPPGSGLLKDLEETAYRAQARYILDQMSGQPTAAQATIATQVSPTAGDLVLLAVLLETFSDPAKYQPSAVQLFAVAPTGSQLTPAQVVGLVRQPAFVKSKLEQGIQGIRGMTPTAGATLDGLTGESMIHWIHRL